jgi:hypothetical protein
MASMSPPKLVLLAGSMMLSSCALLPAARSPTPFPIDAVATAVYGTALAMEAATQAATPATPTVGGPSTLQPATPTPAESPTSDPGKPLAAIQVFTPGPLSRVLSPLQANLLVIAGESGRVEIALFGQDGRLLGRSLLAASANPTGDRLAVQLPFEIRAAEEAGYLQVSTRNAKGRIQSLTTVPLQLLSLGENQVNPAGDAIYERVRFSSPSPQFVASGGVLEIECQMLPYNRQPVVMDLITEAGTILSSRIVDVSGAEWQPLETTLPFRVSTTTRARLYLHQADDVLGGNGYLFSQSVVLNP